MFDDWGFDAGGYYATPDMFTTTDWSYGAPDMSTDWGSGFGLTDYGTDQSYFNAPNLYGGSIPTWGDYSFTPSQDYFGTGNVIGGNYDPSQFEQMTNDPNWYENTGNGLWSGPDSSLWGGLASQFLGSLMNQGGGQGGGQAPGGQGQKPGGFLGNLLGGNGSALGGLLGGLYGLQDGKKDQTETAYSKMDPRMDAMVYGDGGFLKSAQDLFNQTKGGNPLIQQGAQAMADYYNSPQYTQGHQNLMNMGQGLLGNIAGNGYGKVGR